MGADPFLFLASSHQPGEAAGAPSIALTCAACDRPLQAGGLNYRGIQYLQCAHCRIARMAVVPTATSLRHQYEIEYPLRHPPDRLARARAEVFALILDRIEGLRKPGQLLDVGCGGGHLLKVADQRGWRCLGTDLSYRACTVVHQACGVEVVQADSAQVPLRDACVDVVTFVNVLDHVPDPLGALGEAHRVLTSGGFLAIRIPNAAFHRPWVWLMALCGALAQRRGWDRYPILHLYVFTARGLRRLVERAGFRVVEVRNSPFAAEWMWSSGAGLRSAALACIREFIAGGAASVALLSSGRWVVGPSIELYARRPAAEEREPAG